MEIISGYRERACLVALLASMYPSTIGYSDPVEPEWPVVTIKLPTGQACWHISPDDVDLFEGVKRNDESEWDGHTTEEKYNRVMAYARWNHDGMGEVKVDNG